jgi:hypothetical protein
MRLLLHLLLLAMCMQTMHWWHGSSKHTGHVAWSLHKPSNITNPLNISQISWKENICLYQHIMSIILKHNSDCHHLQIFLHLQVPALSTFTPPRFSYNNSNHAFKQYFSFTQICKHLQLILISLVKPKHSHTKALLRQVIPFEFSEKERWEDFCL